MRDNTLSEQSLEELGSPAKLRYTTTSVITIWAHSKFSPNLFFMLVMLGENGWVAEKCTWVDKG